MANPYKHEFKVRNFTFQDDMFENFDQNTRLVGFTLQYDLLF